MVKVVWRPVLAVFPPKLPANHNRVTSLVVCKREGSSDQQLAVARAAADLFRSGTEQLILGYAAEWEAIPSYVALQLFTLDGNVATPSLHCECKTLVGDDMAPKTSSTPPFGTVRLQIAGGVFGATKDIIEGKGCFGVYDADNTGGNYVYWRDYVPK